MAYGSDDNTTRGAAPPDDSKATDGDDIARRVVRLYEDWYEREQENVNLAYEDLRFSRNGEQWPDNLKRVRDEEGRPSLTINKCPQYVRQVTGDIRMSRPAIKVVPVDDSGDMKTAEVLAGVVRYVENRADAQAAYFMGCDTQVTAGVGGWQVITEYAGDTTFNLDLGIKPVDDAIAIAWDPDSIEPTREDANWCIVPVDMSREAFKKRWPDATAADFDTLPTPQAAGWWSQDSVRVATYWCKEPIKRKLALLPDARVIDLTALEESKDPQAKAKAKEFEAAAERVEERASHKICRYVTSAQEVLEGPTDWPGKHIPIVPVLGEEVRIGRKVVRNGLIRYMKESQRVYNYAYSTYVEGIALQPKAPFLGTAKNFEKYQEEWAQANRKNQPFIPYTPDPLNGNAPPQRVQPAIPSEGFQSLLLQAAQDLKDVTGIHEASLGAQSNETSGKAILARQREGDVSTYVYQDNFARAVRYTGKILIDLIPKIYDTPRTLRIIGEDGKPDLVKINQKAGETMDETGQAIDLIENDVTVGAYDVVLEMGPSFATRREEARDGMNAFLQSAPQAAPLVLDLIAKDQDWPSADKIAKRLKTMLPPPIQAMEAQESGEPPPPAPPPPPGAMLQEKEQEAKTLQAQQAARKAGYDADKSEVELLLAKLQLGLDPMAPLPPIPMLPPGPPQMATGGQQMPGDPVPPGMGGPPPMGPAGAPPPNFMPPPGAHPPIGPDMGPQSFG